MKIAKLRKNEEENNLLKIEVYQKILLKENHENLQTNCASIKKQYVVAVQRRQVSRQTLLLIKSNYVDESRKNLLHAHIDGCRSKFDNLASTTLRTFSYQIAGLSECLKI